MTRKNLPLIVGIALPIFFIVVISVLIYTPSLFVKPQYDFLYTTVDSNYRYLNYQQSYKVENNRIVIEQKPTVENVEYAGEAPTLYRYDIQTNAARQISFYDAANLSLDPGPTSPDGYTVSYSYSHDGIFELFGSNGNNSGYYVANSTGKKRLGGLTIGRYGDGGFTFIGWVLQ